MENAWLLVVPLALIGGFAGVIGGLLGVGGGIVLVPAFFHAFSWLGFGGEGLMQLCVGTSMATILVTSVRSLAAHNRRRAVDWKVLKSWSIWLGLSSALGVFFAARVSSLSLQVIFGVLAGLAGLWMAFGSENARLSRDMPQGAVKAAIASLIGFFSATMGIGGGTFGVPIMTLFSLPIHRAVGTASGFGLIISVPSIFGFLLTRLPNPPPFTVGSVNLPAFFLVIGTTFLTTPWGVYLAHRLDPVPLKRVFAIFLTLVALNMLRQAFH